MIDFLPAYHIAGIISMLVYRQNRRLGDLVAGTLCVRDWLTEDAVRLGTALGQ